MDINTENVLANLKDFQKNTVEYVFEKLYGKGSTTDRFLIADEVGLGKTLIAKGIVAKAIDRLREDGVKRIDIVYICSNGIIAQQNINRLNLTDQKDLAISSRLTLLPIYGNLDKNEINFISLTPGTSFNLKSRGGMYIERVLLFHLINIAWQIEDESPALELLRVTQEFKNFQWHVKDFKPTRLSPDIVKEYSEKLNSYPKLKQTWDEMINRCIELGGQLDYNLRQDRLKFIGELRRILAQVCITYLEPDIIIMDEFQKFRDMLDQPEKDNTGIASFAHQLFNYKDKITKQPAKLILLSATPYKMYTTSYEKASAIDNHYEDFFATTRFLQNDDESENLDLQQALSNFGDAFANFIRTDGKDLDDIQQCKKHVEDLLLKVMVRTERLVAFTGEDERNGMLRTVPSTVTNIEVNNSQDMLHFRKLPIKLGIMIFWSIGSLLPTY